MPCIFLHCNISGPRSCPHLLLVTLRLTVLFETKNKYYLSPTKNIRKNSFMPILKSLSEETTYTKNGSTYTTIYNNGFIENINNKVKLVQRNTYDYQYFNNLRKRILLHIRFAYEFR